MKLLLVILAVELWNTSCLVGISSYINTCNFSLRPPWNYADTHCKRVRRRDE